MSQYSALDCILTVENLGNNNRKKNFRNIDLQNEKFPRRNRH